MLRFHIPFTRLADLVEGRLSPEEQMRVDTHVATCPRCSQELTQLQHLIGLMRSDPLEDAPPHLIVSVVRLFRPQPVSEAPSLLRRIAAILRIESTALTPAFGLRSGQPAARQFLYSAENYDLDLRVTPNGDGWAVSGQVLTPVTGGEVELQGATNRYQAHLNQQSEFSLPPTQAGVYRLTFYLTDVEIAIDDLKLGT